MIYVQICNMAFVVHTFWRNIYIFEKSCKIWADCNASFYNTICHFNVSNNDTVSTKTDYRGIFIVIKVLLSFVIQVMYENLI